MMTITIAPNGILQIDNCRIIFRNLSGIQTEYNREGDKNFAIVIETQELAEMLRENGWNVKIKAPRSEEDEPLLYLPVKVKFNTHGPNVYLTSGGPNLVKLDEMTISQIDNIDILDVSLDVRPYDWEREVVVKGERMVDSGRTAYLQSMKVVQRVDRFMAELAGSEYPGVDDKDTF